MNFGVEIMPFEVGPDSQSVLPRWRTLIVMRWDDDDAITHDPVPFRMTSIDDIITCDIRPYVFDNHKWMNGFLCYLVDIMLKTMS